MSKEDTPPDLLAFLEAHPTIDFVHYYWVDFCGRLCERVIPVSRCRSLASTSSPVRVGLFCMIGFCNIHASDILRPSGCDALFPDWSSLRLLQPTHASVMCNVAQSYSLQDPGPSEDAFAHCPRSILKKVLSYASDQYSLSFLGGFEIEFYLLDLAEFEQYPNVNRPNYGHLNGAQALRGQQGKCVETCVKRLQAAALSVEQLHAEGGAYQFEISLAPLPAFNATDAVIQALEIIRRTAMEFDFRACFLPKVFSNTGCSGLHMNLSLNEAVAERYTDFFIAGILDRLPGLCAISMPTSESYNRKALFYTGSWVAWGLESRDVPVRKASDHWEIRTVDATSNVYLAMAAYIAAGIAGIASQSPLKVRDCRDFLSTKQSRVDAGVEVPIPATIDIACDHFDELLTDKLFTDILGGSILSFYKVVHKGSLDSVGDMTEQDRKRMYLELF